jgi:hypothetical protein
VDARGQIAAGGSCRIFYFDESGDFAAGAGPGDHRAAVVMDVAVSEAVYEALARDYRKFVESLDFNELGSGEPKGRLLSRQSRQRFCDLLASFDGVSLTPVTLELSSLGTRYEEESRFRMQDAFRSNADRMIHEAARHDLLLASQQYKNLSPNQSLRLYSIANCIREALQHAILFLSDGPHRSCWERVSLEIDRVQTRSGSREEQLFNVMLRGWLLGWSVTKPFIFVRELHVDWEIELRSRSGSDKALSVRST